VRVHWREAHVTHPTRFCWRPSRLAIHPRLAVLLTQITHHCTPAGNALSILVNQLGYNGPALTCKFYSCTGAGNVSLPVFSRLAYVSASVCASYSSSLASLVCTPPLRTTPAPGTGFLCGADNSCVSVSSVPGAGPTEGVSLGVCRETCGAAAGTYACAGAQGCQLSSAGGSLYACQQTCTAAAEKPPFM
jgi:hypothetical protein